MNFKDKTIVVTGASGNLGRTVAKSFADRGARLVLIDLNTDTLESLFSDAERHLCMPVNLLQQDDVNVGIDRAIERFGGVDVLCCLAGGFRMGEAVHETSALNWDFLLDVNVGSLMSMARAVVPHMLAAGSGKIVNVGAFAAQKGIAYMGAYVASKSAVARLTESMSAELRERGINVNCVLPTILDTAENRLAMPDADPSRWVATQDLANVIVFLASDEAKAIHGASLAVCGLS